MTDYLAAVMVGARPGPESLCEDPAAWDRLHLPTGIQLPPDYRVLVDAHTPPFRSMGTFTSPTPRPRGGTWRVHPQHDQAWSEVSWDDLDADEDCLLFDLDELSFGTRNGLWPIASTDRGEFIFLIAAPDAPRFLVSFDETWAEHRMSFAEWLYRYLIGEDMTGPNSAAFTPGVRLQHLPMSAGERPERPDTAQTAACEKPLVHSRQQPDEITSWEAVQGL
ncbi:SMI1/KNR4 family protein [Streptomyces sp. KL116D]|uniref:SMI1/KNR4 family protein n=1 Tax=Streptomyces sp. KL116D TaxID=3045152 RepID=UPI00355824B3